MSTASLSGDATALIVRALLDFRSLWTTHDLATLTGVQAAAIRRIVDRLEREGVVERRGPGIVDVPNWQALLQRWTEDTHFTQRVRLTYWRAKRGPQTLLERIPFTPVRHAVTGSHAARVWAPETPVGPTVIYTPDAREAATAWELVPARKTSLVLAEPRGKSAFARPRKTATGLHLAAPSQVLADLLTGATKSPAAADALATWMLDHELGWRY
jgi:hypothetical protein